MIDILLRSNDAKTQTYTDIHIAIIYLPKTPTILNAEKPPPQNT